MLLVTVVAKLYLWLYTMVRGKIFQADYGSSKIHQAFLGVAPNAFTCPLCVISSYAERRFGALTIRPPGYFY